MINNEAVNQSEDEDDLEMLRLAALQSLKKKSQMELNNQAIMHNQFNGSPRNKHKRGRFFGPNHQNRHARNGQNNWVRNSNLIAIPVISDETEIVSEKKIDKNDPPKLILPQDRYFKSNPTELDLNNDEPSSKFDRYDNSDDSESEYEDNSRKTSKYHQNNFKKTAINSTVEELNVDNPTIDNSKLKKLTDDSSNVKKVTDDTLNVKMTDEGTNLKKSSSIEAIISELENEIQKDSIPKKPNSLKENLKPPEKSFVQQKRKNFSPKKWPTSNRSKPPIVNNFPPIIETTQQFVPPPFPYMNPPMTHPPPQINHLMYENPIYHHQQIPINIPPPLINNHYERPLSPLIISTDLPISSLAPLSPRSAEFVLKNREIIEKRKRSPRKSYSRSPSPRYRRSKSPISPIKGKMKRRSLTPIKKSQKTSIHERLGAKSKRVEEKIEDPILEARRKKFENKELTITEGVIKLKNKDSEGEVKELKDLSEKIDEIDEDELLLGDDAIDLDVKDDYLLSDEESDDDNEGRFKNQAESGQQVEKKIAVLPFTKLIGNSNSDKLNLDDNNRKLDKKKFDFTIRNGGSKRISRSRTPLVRRRSDSSSSAISRNSKSILRSKKRSSDNKLKKSVIPTNNDSRRIIEIKIRNPAKYEKTEKNNEKLDGIERLSDIRKVKIADNADSNVTTEDNENVNEGDLRAQLSRKRAERQKHPILEDVPTQRLLQNALEGAVFTKKQRRKEKSVTSDGKLPIHLRLGAVNSPKSRKSSKSRSGSSDQELYDK